MVDCADCCMFYSAPGCVFLFYLGFLVSIGSETVYSTPKNVFSSAIALFLASFVYACCFAFSYYTKYYTIQRHEDLNQWINQHEVKQVEMENLQHEELKEQQVRLD